MNLSRVPTLPTVPQTGVWYRGVPPTRYPADILRMAYTVSYASRFSAGPAASPAFQTLYLAQSPEVALRELEALYGPPGGTLSNLRAVTLFGVEVQLQRLVDLTDPGVQAALGTTLQELTGDWRGYAVRAALASPPVAAAPRADPAPGRGPVRLRGRGPSDSVREGAVSVFAGCLPGELAPRQFHPACGTGDGPIVPTLKTRFIFCLLGWFVRRSLPGLYAQRLRS